MIRKNLMKSFSVIMAAMLAVMTVACGKTTTDTEAVAAATMASDEAKIENSMLTASGIASTESEAGKVETVYVTADANGAVNDVIVSEWLKNVTASSELSDSTELKNIVNVKGSETFTENADGTLTWNADGSDIYYQGTTDKELPVTMKITYTLDGKEISPEELAGKSGRVTMRFEYENNAKKTVEVNGKKIDVYTPFAMVSGMMLDADKFTNVEISNGKVISDGGNYVVMGVATPGLKESLDISDDKWEKLEDGDEIKDKLSNSFEVTADTVDFELGMTVTMASSDILSDFGVSDLTNSDKINDLKDDMGELNDGSDKLVDGTKTLKDGTKELRDGTGKLLDGTTELSDGAKKLYDGSATLSDGARQLYGGTATLSDGAKQLYGGTSELSDGARQLYGGTATLSDGAKQLYGGTAELSDGARQLYSGATELSDGTNKLYDGTGSLAEGAGSLKVGTGKLYAGVKAYTDGTAQINDGAIELAGGAGKLQQGVDTLNSSVGTELLTNAQALKNGASQIKDGTALLSSTLQSKAGELSQQYLIYSTIESWLENRGTLAVPGGVDEEAFDDYLSNISDGQITSVAAANYFMGNVNSAMELIGGMSTGAFTVSMTAIPSNEEAPVVEVETGTLTNPEEQEFEEQQRQEEIRNMQEQQAVEEQREQQETIERSAFREIVDENGIATTEEFTVEYREGDPIPFEPADSELIPDETDEDNLNSTKTMIITAGNPEYPSLDVATVASAQKAVAGYYQMLGAAKAATSAVKQSIDLFTTQNPQTGATMMESISALASGASSLYDGTDKFEAGINKLYSGTTELSKGAKELTAGAEKLATGTRTLTAKNGELVDGASELDKGADKLSAGARELKEGTGKLKDGAGSLKDGSGKLSSGADQLKEGAGRLSSGADELNSGAGKLSSGADQLKEGAGKLSSGADELNSGAGKLSSGADELKDGAGKLSDGAAELNSGATELNNGVIKLDDGVQELLDGMVKFDKEGIKKLYEAFDGDLTDFADRITAIQEAGSSYTSFGGAEEEIDSSVKFIIRTDSIKSL